MSNFNFNLDIYGLTSTIFKNHWKRFFRIKSLFFIYLFEEYFKDFLTTPAMDFHDTALVFLRSTRQIPSVDEDDFYPDRMELDVKVDIIYIFDKSRTSFTSF